MLSAREARTNAELQLEGEQRLYQVGRSTTFLLFQRENALANARASELRAETDYNKALADLQRATSTTLRANNVVVDTPSGPITPKPITPFQRHISLVFLVRFAASLGNSDFRMKITATIITFNEESNIKAPASLSPGPTRSSSSTQTRLTQRASIASRVRRANVITNEWPGFGAQKQFAVESAQHDWIFSLDADERVSDQLRDSIEHS